MNNEPVAWISKFCLQYLEEGYDTKAYPKENEHANIPLYTHPTKTLTDEEILEVAKEMGWRGALGFLIRFARAILRKAQEK